MTHNHNLLSLSKEGRNKTHTRLCMSRQQFTDQKDVDESSKEIQRYSRTVTMLSMTESGKERRYRLMGAESLNGYCL